MQAWSGQLSDLQDLAQNTNFRKGLGCSSVKSSWVPSPLEQKQSKAKQNKEKVSAYARPTLNEKVESKQFLFPMKSVWNAQPSWGTDLIPEVLNEAQSLQSSVYCHVLGSYSLQAL